jgi:sarcosine oxidase subunit alpha
LTSTHLDEAVAFTFEGRTVSARPGQSIASAIMQSGTPVLTRSFKYRRPRGYTCGYDMCGNCPVTINGLPGVTSCTTPVQGGEVVRRERGWPSTDRDLMRAIDLMARFVPAGFQFRLFRSRPRLAHLAEKVMGRVAGAGRFPTPEAARRARTRTEVDAADVLVVGGGMSGCAAALGAAGTGASVTLVHPGRLGGRANARDSVVTHDGETARAADVAGRLASAVLAHDDIRVVDGFVMSYFETGVIPVVADGLLLECRPKHLVVATGSYDVPGVFPGNDKPGVVLADGVSKLLRVDRVVPWRRAVVMTDGDRGRALADQLQEAGVEVAAIVVQREAGDPPEPGSASAGRQLDDDGVLRGAVRAARGAKVLRAVDVEVDGRVRTIRADLLCVALTPRPANDLALQRQYVAAGTTDAVGGGWAGADLSASTPGLSVIGSAAGWTEDDPDRARAVGAAAGSNSTQGK